ncbi:ABC transporter permease [Paenibacillus sp. GYB003]|uniref:ABC transporter permease n=1 Tax=Paenibacillus sp. GYB003 TaxID=2994392 RepID=UPI002F96AFC4
MLQRTVSFFALMLLRLLLLLAAIGIVSFALASASPIDPIQAYVGADMMRVGPEQRQLIAERWGLDQSAPQRFAQWATALLHGDLGTSMIYRLPVADVIRERFAGSLALMSVSWTLSGLLGFAAGVAAAMNEGNWLDKLIRWYCYTLASTPTFWMGLLLLTVFAVWLGWLPIGLGTPAGVVDAQVTAVDRIRHMILPAMTLSIVGIAPIALHTRQKLIDVLASDYILFARARGERGFRLLRTHALRGVWLPAVSLHFASFSELFGGAVLAEQVFAYPGLGQATVAAGLRGDVPLLLGIVLFSALFVFIGNTVADALYKLVDPRLREGRAT